MCVNMYVYIFIRMIMRLYIYERVDISIISIMVMGDTIELAILHHSTLNKMPTYRVIAP